MQLGEAAWGRRWGCCPACARASAWWPGQRGAPRRREAAVAERTRAQSCSGSRASASASPSSPRCSSCSSACWAWPATASSASTASPRSTSPWSPSSPACPAPRPRRWRPRSPTRSRRRSTPSAASTSCAPSPSEGVSHGHHQLRAGEEHRRRRAGGARPASATVLPELPQATSTRPSCSKLDPGRRAGPLPGAQRASGPSARSPRSPTSEVRRQLENVTGVGQVTLSAARKRQINVWLDPVKLRGGGLTRRRRAARHRRAEPHRARRQPSRPAPST